MKCSECGVENEDSVKFCSSCGVDLNKEKKSFWKHLFKWKYYIFPLFVGLLFGFDYTQIGGNPLSGIQFVGFIMGVVMATQLHSKLTKKIGMFFLGGFLTNILAVVAYFVFIYAYGLFSNNGQELLVQKILATNKTFPKMLNDEIQLLKYTSDGKNSVKLHLKFIMYTKNEILSDYKNNNDFENDMLDSELKSSCTMKGLKKMLASGLVNWIAYYGKNDELIGQIYLDNERCKPYYK